MIPFVIVPENTTSLYESYQKVYEECLEGNKPCVLSEESTCKWLARTDWTYPDGSLKFDFLRSRFGRAGVPVVQSDEQSDYASRLQVPVSFDDYLEHLESKRPLSGINAPHGHVWYLKDWHFQRAFPEYRAYTVPLYFSSDWLNEYCDARYPYEPDKDYRFLYLGPKGSWTPFHEDVLQSFSWSANVSGTKKWYIFPAGEEQKLIQADGQLPSDVTRPGEVIFIPSGWHHQVHNLDTTLSVNHNWINAATVGNLWNLLRDSLNKVKQEIEDCAADFVDAHEWNRQCQMILKADLGMNYPEFFDLLLFIGTRRIQCDNEHEQYEFVRMKDIESIRGTFKQVEFSLDELPREDGAPDAIRKFLEVL
ncbi:2-oxoglutarate and iron-dependent oxygenase JMJD4-like isoform X2 [Paramacrobiotus metropolitanus]|uniref:2-oxoglutarate and iron-dependent oxygenase JMJD4-like isoform X2 n=1 Tax=Paramacrobiotus metropolitanus TaxID=2943436 RepID=UPI0024461E0E|nr:2-oxoglutarate and iron-dependent oxygenase JMJD4-like isoform X2 [Paramacrobiotus metropolitanus]